MVFSSAAFLFLFLPIVLVGYYLVARWRKLGNLFLTLASLGFYAWGEPTFVFVMLLSITVNWALGLWVDRTRGDPRRAKGVIALTAVFNLGLLGVFKYLMFLMESANWAFGLRLPVPQITLPIGISFFTFQAMSYVIDVYRGKGEVQKSWLNVCLYISFFPQLIAGPIVRYQTIAHEIEGRRENLTDFVEGVRRFMVGLCKKVILANNLGMMVDAAFALDSKNLSVVSAWLAACAYLMQVYYDFSGYSDMAIGLGRMFGFHFLENFNLPFLSKSVAEFWRRWHISLGTWFQDYLYFPLGGSRVKTRARLLFNMFMVWFLTGLWHGAAWTYALWGTGFFVMLAVERLSGLGKWMEKRPVGHFYAMLMVTVITVMIRSADLNNAWVFYGSMFGVNGARFLDDVAGIFIREYGWFFLAAVICGLPVRDFLKNRLRVPEGALEIGGAVGLLLLTAVSISYVAMGSYNPFIYFNF